MKPITIKSGVGVTLASLTMLLATACGSSVDRVDLSNPDNAREIACDQRVDAANELSLADSLPENDGERADLLKAWGITSSELSEAKKALDARSDACDGKPSSTPTPSATAVAAQQPIKGTGSPRDTCPKEIVQNFDNNPKGNFSSDGIKGSDDFLTKLGHDARYLAFVGHERLPKVVSADARPLLTPDAKCLSVKGEQTWWYLKGTLSSPTVKVDKHTTAPADGYNTAMQDGRGVVDPKRGVGGDRSAITYTFPNGDKLIVMYRCGNPVFVKPPADVPKGPTDHQRPPKETPSPSTPPASPPPGHEAKNPSQIPGNGGEGDGGGDKYGGTGTDRQTADPKPDDKPTADNPPDTYDPPAKPRPTGPPAGSTPTTNPPPPREPGAGDSNSNTGMPNLP